MSSSTLFQRLFHQPYLLLSLTTLFWAGNTIAGKLAVGHISPFLLTNLRWIAAMALVYPFAWPHLKREWPVIRANLVFLAILGAIGFAVFNNLMYMALTKTSALNVAIVQASMPLTVFLFNFLLFGLRTTAFQLFGFTLTLIGVILIAAQGQWSNLIALQINFGDLLMLIAVLTYGIYSVFLTKKPDIHWLSFIAVLGTSAMITSIAFSAWEVSTNNAIWPGVEGWLVVLYTAIFPSILSQVFWMRGLEIIGSNRGGIFINLVPIIGSALAIGLLGEDFYTYHALALVLVLGGVWIAQKARVAKA